MRRYSLSDEEQKRRDDVFLKRVAIIGGDATARKVAAMLADSDAANGGIVVLDAEPSRERDHAKSANLLPYIIHSMARMGPPISPVLRKLRKSKPTKPCAECGEMHSHNNRWCSPECCRVYREKEGK